MSQKIFETKQLKFPYQYKFPGQASDERILYAVRENKILLRIRQLVVLIGALTVLVTGLIIKQLLTSAFGSIGVLFELLVLVAATGFLAVGWWWVSSLWQKSIALVTTKRLTKFIYTTPVSRYSLTLPLDNIVDTGAYTKGFVQTFLKLGTFIARSSAASSGVATDDPSRVNKKYFYIENIKRAEDLQHYVSKLLNAFHKYPEKLENFRPFIPHLKGKARADFIQKNYPHFKT